MPTRSISFRYIYIVHNRSNAVERSTMLTVLFYIALSLVCVRAIVSCLDWLKDRFFHR